jgi:hypothetical protein
LGSRVNDGGNEKSRAFSLPGLDDFPKVLENVLLVGAGFRSRSIGARGGVGTRRFSRFAANHNYQAQ